MSDIATGERLRIGAVIGTTLGLLNRNFPLFAILGLLLAGLPTAIFGALRAFGVIEPPGDDIAAAARGAPGEQLILGLAGIVLQGALLRACLDDVAGRRPDLTRSLQTGRELFLGLLAIGIVVNFAVILGLILLIVPGVYLILRWMLAQVSHVDRERGWRDALARSSRLTDGNRWVLLGLLVILLLGFGLLLIASSLPFFILPEGPIADNFSYLVMEPLLGAVLTVVPIVATAAAYIELRRAKEGLGVGEDVSVFD